MLKKLLSVLMVICLCASFYGCNGDEDKQGTDIANKPAKGFSAAGKVFKGGDEQQEKINAFSYTEEASEGVSTITFSFKVGSMIGGDEEETNADILPGYRVYLTEAPARVAIELTGVQYWDYEYNTTTDVDSVAVGMFRTEIKDNPTSTIYIQLSQSSYFNVSQQNNNLVIKLMPISTADETVQDNQDVEPVDDNNRSYYCIGNTYNAYKSGLLAAEDGLTPTLTDNYSMVIMISEPFSTQQAAEKFKNSLITKNEAVATANWQIIDLGKGELPKISAKYNYEIAASYKIARIEGVEIALELFEPNAIYLSTNPNNGGIVYSKFVSTSGSDVGYEELWTKDPEGNESLMLKQTFYSIEQVLYSPNGNYFTLLESTDSGSCLYLYNGFTNELISNLTNVGFGNMVSSVVWDFFGTKLYAIGGVDGLGIHQYDLLIRDPQMRHSVLYNKSFDDAGLSYLDGELLFVRSTQEKGSYIYKIMPDGGSQKQFLKGNAFAVSPNGLYLAYVDTGDYQYENANTSVTIMNTETGEKDTFDPCFAVYSLMWTSDSSRLMFFENRMSGNTGDDGGTDDGTDTDQDTTTEEDKYPYSLWSYTLSSKKLKNHADLNTMYAIPSSTNPSAVYVIHSAMREFEISATYILNLK